MVRDPCRRMMGDGRMRWWCCCTATRTETGGRRGTGHGGAPRGAPAPAPHILYLYIFLLLILVLLRQEPEPKKLYNLLLFILPYIELLIYAKKKGAVFGVILAARCVGRCALRTAPSSAPGPCYMHHYDFRFGDGPAPSSVGSVALWPRAAFSFFLTRSRCPH